MDLKNKKLNVVSLRKNFISRVANKIEYNLLRLNRHEGITDTFYSSIFYK